MTKATIAVFDYGQATQRRTLGVLATSQVIGGIGIGASVSVGALLAEDLSGSRAWSGMAATLTTLGAAAWAIPLARAADHRGRRFALTCGWTLSGAGAALTVPAAVVGSFVLLLVALMLMGAGNAANLQSRFAATDLAPASSRARSLGLVVWATTVGAVAGPNLIRPGAVLASELGIPDLSGPFVFSAVAAFAAAAAISVALRPDPLLTARSIAVGEKLSAEPSSQNSDPSMGALEAIGSSATARSALAAIVTSQAVMVAVMAMTPVHMNGHGARLTVIGFTISLHIAGMYALAPIVGWFADRKGRTPAILFGQALLLAATMVTATAGSSEGRIAIGLAMLGLGWSFSTVAASTQLVESVSAAQRPKVQGTSDLLMNLAGASAGAASGLLVAVVGYAGLSLVAACAVLPAVLVALTTARRPPMAIG